VTEPSLLAALGPVLDALESLGTPHYVGGSLASSAHGIPRASIDADLLADLAPSDVDRLLAALGEAYYVSEERVRDAVARRSSFNLIHLATMLKVDVFVAKDRTFDRRALERARGERLEGERGRLVPLATAEDIVLAKLEWYRKGGEVSERQWTDVLGVLRASGERLDLGYLKLLATELGVMDLLDRALGESALAP
jgi:hypothetical protein